MAVALELRTAKVIAEVELAAGALVAKLATDIEARAKDHAPVDTGYLRRSIIADRQSQLGVSDSGALVGDVGGADSSAQGNLEWIVMAGAEYAAYVELGTANAGAQPYLLPAVEEVRGGVGSEVDVAIGTPL